MTTREAIEKHSTRAKEVEELNCPDWTKGGKAIMRRGFHNTCVSVIVAASLGTLAMGAFFADPLILSAQTYGEKIDISSLTFPTDQPATALASEHTPGTPAAVWGYLKLPNESTRPLPAVIFAHGCNGIRTNMDIWVPELNRLGVATFVLDSFSGRGVKEICTGDRVNIASILVDIYRSLALLASRPGIDPQRIALMGFSSGGQATLWASQLRFQRTWMPTGNYQYAAYLGIYPVCEFPIDHEDQIVDRPIRIFQGTADELIGACTTYVDQMRESGKDVMLTAYQGASHGFDWNDRNPGNANARTKAVQDVGAFLRQVFKSGY